MIFLNRRMMVRKTTKKKPKKKKSRTRKTLVRLLDSAVSRFIRQRDGKCVLCGSTEKLTNGHVFSRAHYSTRWDTRPNGDCHCQCMGCNLVHEHDPFLYYRWYVEQFGWDRLNALHDEWKPSSSLTTQDLEQRLKEVEDLLTPQQC